MALNKNQFITEAQADEINRNPDSTHMAIRVGEKWARIPKMPEAYKNSDGRIVRASLRLHISNYISNLGLTPCELPKKKVAEPAPAPAEQGEGENAAAGLLSADLVEKLDGLVAEGVDLESESLKDIASAIGVTRVTKAQLQQYLAR